MKNVSTFGVHQDEDKVTWLIQQGGAQNVHGIKTEPDIKVRQRRCNHEIILAGSMFASNILEEYYDSKSMPLLDLMKPVPRTDEGVYFIDENDSVIRTLATLSRMSSPIMPIVVPVWAYVERKQLYDALNQSNIQPLVLTGVKTSDSGLLREFARVAKNTPRRLIFTGESSYVPPGIKHWNMVATLANPHHGFEWEAIGADLLRKWIVKTDGT